MVNSTLFSGRSGVAFSRLGTSLTLVVLTAFLATACRTAPEQTQTSSDVVVSAPADGVVRSILVTEGAAVDKDAAIIEIAVSLQQPVPSQPSKANTEQRRALRAAETDLTSAESEANRTSGELRRIEPLVRRGLASQGELDKARVQSQDAQERLRLARDKAKTAEEALNQPPVPTANETVIAVRIPAAGTVRTLNVEAGQVVKLGQPVATLRART